MRFLDLPDDVLYTLLSTAPWCAQSMSLVHPRLRSLAFPWLWHTQMINMDKAKYLLEHPHLLSYIRRATFVPDAFFGGDDEEPLAEHLSLMFSTILSGLTRVYEITLPHSRDQATRKLLALAPSITTLRFSHVQPTVSHIELLAEACPNLKHLWFTLYWFQNSFWILKEENLEAFAVALSKFPLLETIDLAASAHFFEPRAGISTFARMELEDIESGDVPGVIYDSTAERGYGGLPVPNPALKPSLIMQNISPDYRSRAQERATKVIAARCPQLRRIVWSSPHNTSPLSLPKPVPIEGEAPNTPAPVTLIETRLDVWVWRIVGQDEIVRNQDDGIVLPPGSVFCEQRTKRVQSFIDVFKKMKSLV